MSQFDRPAEIIAALQADAGLTRRVELLVKQRFNLTPERYRALFWVLLAEAACEGARLVMADLNENAANKEQQ